jgi:hypothetical protein
VVLVKPLPPAVGTVVRDTTTDRVGVVMGVLGELVYLRPQGGGVEWTARAGELEPVDRFGELRARVGELNTNSIRRRL